MTNTEKFEKLIDIIDYGMLYQKDFITEDVVDEYELGVVDATRHIASCCIVNWFDTDGMCAGDICHFLKLNNFPNREEIEKRLKELFNTLGFSGKN